VTNGQLLAESGHELVIGGYGPGAHTRLRLHNCWLFPHKELVYIALVRTGFVRRKDTIVPNVPKLHQNSALESAVQNVKTASIELMGVRRLEPLTTC
jgi:hypothetical protein